MPPAAVPLVRLHDPDTALVEPPARTGDARGFWLNAFRAVRAETECRAVTLSAEDQVVQSMPDASPTKWHRAHVTWFFEQFLLRPFAPDYKPFDERFAFLFNSYYVAAGPRQARPQRGLITRPGVAETAAYRAHVDAAVAALIETAPAQNVEFVLSHCDNIEATGFVEHLKLPHHVDFQSELETIRAMRAEALSALKQAETKRESETP